MAGLWDRWEKGSEGPLETFTILTTDPNEVVAPVHKRMPVILAAEHHGPWLDPDHQDVNSLLPLLAPAPSELLESFPVSTYVNNPAHEGPDCIAPVD
jgi:putative SOS response-associated peptidase YedK